MKKIYKGALILLAGTLLINGYANAQSLNKLTKEEKIESIKANLKQFAYNALPTSNERWAKQQVVGTTNYQSYDGTGFDLKVDSTSYFYTDGQQAKFTGSDMEFMSYVVLAPQFMNQVSPNYYIANESGYDNIFNYSSCSEFNFEINAASGYTEENEISEEGDLLKTTSSMNGVPYYENKFTYDEGKLYMSIGSSYNNTQDEWVVNETTEYHYNNNGTISSSYYTYYDDDGTLIEDAVYYYSYYPGSRIKSIEYYDYLDGDYAFKIDYIYNSNAEVEQIDYAINDAVEGWTPYITINNQYNSNGLVNRVEFLYLEEGEAERIEISYTSDKKIKTIINSSYLLVDGVEEEFQYESKEEFSYNSNGDLITAEYYSEYFIGDFFPGEWGSQTVYFYEEFLNVNEETQNLVNVYPNPAQDQINLISQGGIQQLELVDLTGKIVYNETVKGYQTSFVIPVSQLENGVYFVQWKDVNNNIGSRKVVVQ